MDWQARNACRFANDRDGVTSSPCTISHACTLTCTLLFPQRFKERKAHGLKNNAITKFAEKYVIDMGMNPFQKKGGGAVSKE